MRVLSLQLRELVGEEYHDWFSQYLVVKRASIEPNFHALYILVLDTFRSPTLGTVRPPTVAHFLQRR